MNKNKKRVSPTFSLNINAGVSLFLFSQVSMNEHLAELLEVFLSSFPDIKAVFDYVSSIDRYAAVLLAAVVRIAAYFIFLFAKKSFVEQGSLMFKEPKEIIRSGISAYFVLACIILVFFISAVGIPIAVVLFAAAYIIALVGEASISVAIGRTVNGKLFKSYPSNPRIESDMLTGSVLLELTKLLPVVNICLYLFVIPVFSLGVVITAVINGYVKKIFYSSEYSEKSSDSFNYGLIRGIIVTKETNLDGGYEDEEKT